MVLIGVTPTQDDATGRITVHQDYLDAVKRAGGIPVLLPLFGDHELLDGVLEHLDGVLFIGGNDVSPACYGEETLPECGKTAPQRDEMEFYLCRRALEKNLPLLAICRGHQVLNCTLGGTLYQDIASQFGALIKHPCYDVPAKQVHRVRVEYGSLLQQVTGQVKLQVNSRHHQAVKTLGKGLRPIAWAEDGLIEGIQLPGKRFVLGVQWHPETLSSFCPEAQAIFNGFVKACGEGA